MEGLQVIEKSIPCAKCPNQLLKYQAASKQIKNAINPLMLGQKSPPWFQKHGASCRSGIIVNLCYYKCASFPLLCFHTVGKRIWSSVGSVLQSRLNSHSSAQFAFQAMLVRQGMVRRCQFLGRPCSWARHELVSLPRNLVSQIPEAGP